MTKTNESDNKQALEQALEQARAQLDSIVEMVEDMHNAHGDDEHDAALQRINENALSVQVRSGWYPPGGSSEAAEYEILLCTGGPAVRIVGDLDEHNQASDARIQYQDWFTPWTDLVDLTSDDKAALTIYAQQHYFGE